MTVSRGRSTRCSCVRVLCVIAIAGCVVVQPPAERPRWQLTGEQKPLEAGCAIVRPLIRKSGKQGIGVALQLRSRGDCELAFPSARIEFRDGSKLTVTPPAATTLPGRSQIYVWWPVEFDNNTAWNEGRRQATLHLAYNVAGVAGEWSFAMEQ